MVPLLPSGGSPLLVDAHVARVFECALIFDRGARLDGVGLMSLGHGWTVGDMLVLTTNVVVRSGILKDGAQYESDQSFVGREEM